MTNSKQVFQQIVKGIRLDESVEEIQAIAYLVCEKMFGLTQTQIIGQKEVEPVDWNLVEKTLERINAYEPVQYILGEAEFYGRSFFVEPGVLIPRPETELLVTETIAHFKDKRPQAVRILDIGTGSGCIPITLSLALKNATAAGIDVCEKAIEVARANNARLKSKASFTLCNILLEAPPEGKWDAVISNPPYIVDSEKPSIKPNVLQYEPHIALFVSDDDPLRFYHAILRTTENQMQKNGLLAVEINPRFSEAIVELFQKNGFHSIEVIKDMAGRERIIKALAP